MKVLDPGHHYSLGILGDPHQLLRLLLRFVKREGPGYPGNIGHYPGTTLQEVLRACIDRVVYLDRQIPDYHNDNTIFHLREAIRYLEVRAALRHNRPIPEFMKEIESMPTCPKCLHIGCTGTCHA